MPEVSPTDVVEDDVHAITGEATNLIREVLILVVDRDTAQVAHDGRRSR
jgi:hypothetical protein